MGFLTDWLTDWLKELLIEGIMGNLTGLFDTVNSRVGEIAVQVGTTPAAWNAGVFSLIRQLSETVILPIAGLILTFIATYELIQLIIEKNNLHDLDYWIFFKWIFKTACAILILSNTFNIVMAVFDVSQSVIARSAGVIQGRTDVTPDMLDTLETTLEGMDLGPLATEKQLQTVLKYIDIGKQEARLLCGGERLTGGDFDKGYYVAPTVFTDVKNSMRIAQEEIFGPVIALIEVKDFADALAQANDTEYGLAASIVTMNPRYMHQFTNEIQAGTVKINRTTTGNLVNAPFGGLKNSSTSTFRESGRAGLEFFTQVKTVYRGI